MSRPGGLILTVLNDAIKIRVLFRLYQPRLFAMLINSELGDNRSQPSGQ